MRTGDTRASTAGIRGSGELEGWVFRASSIEAEADGVRVSVETFRFREGDDLTAYLG